MKTKQSFFLTITVYLLFTVAAKAEIRPKTKIQIQHQPPTVLVKGETVSLNFAAPAINPNEIERAILFYRLNGKISYKQKQAELQRSNFTVSFNLPENANGSLEYYFKIYFKDRQPQTWPQRNALTDPAQVDIVQSRPALKNKTDIEYTILSPQPGEAITAKDALIAITLFYDETELDTSSVSFRLFFDGEDITNEADASSYFLTYVPEQLIPGEHQVSLKLTSGDSTREITSWYFKIIQPTAEHRQKLQPEKEPFLQNARIELKARNQVISGHSDDILSGDIRISGGKGSVRYAAFGTLTSEENKRLQPQNRYGLELYAGEWLELYAGDVYPFLSPLTITGRRIRGINTAIHLFNQFVNIKFLYGNMRRGITNLYGAVQRDIENFNGSAVDTTYYLNFKNNGSGIYQRKAIGGRISFGRKQNFRLGINLLKVQDDTTSINVIENYDDALQMFPNTLANLSQADRRKLQSQPQLLTVNENPAPKGNVVASTDLMFTLDNSNIRFSGNAGISLLNNDISGGILNSETAEALGFKLDKNNVDMLERLSWLIIINENMNALPFRFKENGNEIESYLPSNVLAAQSGLSLYYFDNTLNIKYRWIGPDFKSLANSAIRNDIAGLTLTDRFSFIDNQIYITLGFENLRNNVTNNRDATTKTTSFRSNVSWYPAAQNLPHISLGAIYRNRNNGVGNYNPYISSNFKNSAVSNYKKVGSETVITTDPRNENTIQLNASATQQFNLLGINHTARLSYTFLNTTDQVFAYGDTRNSAVSFSLNNRFANMPLKTNIGLSYNSTKTLSGLSKIDIFGVNVGGSVFLLNERLNIDANIAFTQNNTRSASLTVNNNGTANYRADDYYTASSPATTGSQAYIFSASARYSITSNQSILLYSRITNISGRKFNIPNDRLLQARYIFTF